MSDLFWLTQRLKRYDNPRREGFDAKFEMDYMGASEYEFGAVPQSLKRMRANLKNLVLHTGTVTRNGVDATVYVLADATGAPTVPDALTEWMTAPYPRGGAITFFPEHVDGTAKDYQQRTNAWWDLTNDLMWTLDATIADDLLAAVKG